MEGYHETKSLLGFTYHRTILLEEILGFVDLKDWFLDCTLGDGGHSLAVLKKGGKIIGIDVDTQALSRTRKRYIEEGIAESEFKLVQGNFRGLENLIKTQTEPVDIKIKTILFDLGVSSLQLLSPERGFSFMHEGPLDMRMDPTLQVTALDLIKSLKKGELEDVFNKLGEEKRAKRLADIIVSSSGVIKNTTDLAGLIERALGRHGKIHPATKIFQALRIVVNDELNALVEGLDQAIQVIAEGGKILVISFHSLEDRIIKNTFLNWEQDGLGKIITKKPLIPTDQEIWENPRSRSAKLRVFEKL